MENKSFRENVKSFPFTDYTKKYERDKLFRQLHISVEIYPDFNKKEIEAKEKIILKAIYDNLEFVELNANELNVHEILVNAEKCDFNYDGKKIVIIFKQAIIKNEEFEINISYSSRPRRGMFFVRPILCPV
jgi:aminopeptidase N